MLITVDFTVLIRIERGLCMWIYKHFLKPVVLCLTCKLFLTSKMSFCFNNETLYFSGCKLLYKQDFARRLGLRCVTCNYCSQLCKKGATKELDGVVRDFCSEDCCRRFQDWYYKASTAGPVGPQTGMYLYFQQCSLTKWIIYLKFISLNRNVFDEYFINYEHWQVIVLDT